jgi:subtilisin family serine protease
MKKIIILFLFVGCSILGIRDKTHIINMQGDIDKIHQSLTEKKIAIDNLIRINHPKLKTNAKNGIIRPDGISQSGNPIYYEKMHGRSQVEVLNGYQVKNNNILGLDLNGEGVEVHVWDWPGILKNHVEFVDPTTNTSIIETSSFESQLIEDNHGTCVSSVIAAQGLFHSENYDITGLAPKLSKLKYFNYIDDDTEIVNELGSNSNFIISNHSYGFPIFTGEDNTQQFEAPEIGAYGSADKFLDEVANLYPYWLYVTAAGNEGNESYTGQLNQGYDLLTNGTLSKNQLTVAAIDVENDFGMTFISPAGLSSAGPANDFRIKPEISALGVLVGVANWDENNNSKLDGYRTASGTSFASPGIAGGAALLQQYYKQLHNSFMRSSTLKGLICHTAKDITNWGPKNITGPDPKTGYGTMDIEKAVKVIQTSENDAFRITENTLADQGSYSLSFNTINADENLVVSLAWNDPYKPSLDNSKDLVNDLDIRVLKQNEVFYPWKLDTTDMTAPALKGDNQVDNLEKIEIENPSGTYTIEVTHKGLLESDQVYSLIISGNGTISTLSAGNLRDDFNKIVTTYMADQDVIDVQQTKNTAIFKSFGLYDLSGKLIEQDLLDNVSSFNIDAAKLNSSIYIIKVLTDSATFTSKVVVE